MTSVPQISRKYLRVWTVKRKKIKMVLFPETQVLDVVGPVSVFEAADRNLPDPMGYEIGLVASVKGMVATSGCISFQAQEVFAQVDLNGVDTILVPGGGQGTPRAMLDRNLCEFIREADRRKIRVASICTGSFILAEAGILNGRKCTTHWSDIEKMRTLFPGVTVLEDVIYHNEDHIWTSAGVTTGIDMALAMLSKDYSSYVSMEVARDLILYMARPGQHDQISDLVTDQDSNERLMQQLVLDMHAAPNKDYSVDQMADRCHMSVRTFTRKFKESFEKTPAAMIREIRVERAGFYMESENLDLKKIAQLVGFSSVDVMRQAMKSTHRNKLQ